MKSFICCVIAFLFCKISLAQETITLNQGEVEQEQYYAKVTFEYVNEKLIIPVQINGKTYRFLLDTGAPTLISKTLSKDLRLPGIERILMSDQSGKTDSVYRTVLPSLQIADIRFTNTPVLIADQPLIFDCLHIDGFVGSNQLRNSIIQISLMDTTIIFTNDITKINIDAAFPTDLWLTSIQSLPYIWVNLHGKKKAREQLLFDSGMNGFYDLSLRHYKIFKKKKIFDVLGQADGSNSIGLLGSADKSLHYKLSLNEMKICKIPFRNIQTITTNNNNSRIGAGLITYGKVTLDYKNRKFYFEPYRKQEYIELKEYHYPFELSLNEQQRLSVGIIWDSSLMDGIEAGDEVINVNGENIESYNVCDFIQQRIRYKDLSSLLITFKKKDGFIKQLTLEGQ